MGIHAKKVLLRKTYFNKKSVKKSNESRRHFDISESSNQ